MDFDATEFIGQRIARVFVNDDDMEDIFYGTVISNERFLVKRTRSSRHEEVWNVLYDDLDSEQMNRFELARAIALAERLGYQDPAGGPGSEEENPGSPGEEEDADIPDEDPMDVDGEDMLQRPDIQRFLVHEPLMINSDSFQYEVDDKWLQNLCIAVERNIFSYLDDLAADKLKYRDTDEHATTRLQRDALAFAVALPESYRQLQAAAKDSWVSYIGGCCQTQMHDAWLLLLLVWCRRPKAF